MDNLQKTCNFSTTVKRTGPPVGWYAQADRQVGTQAKAQILLLQFIRWIYTLLLIMNIFFELVAFWNKTFQPTSGRHFRQNDVDIYASNMVQNSFMLLFLTIIVTFRFVFFAVFF